MVTHNYKELCADLLEALEDQWIGDERDDPEIVIRAREILSQDHLLPDGHLTDQYIIDAANRSGVFYPFELDLGPDPKDWNDEQSDAMRRLRAFAQEIINSVTPS